MRHDRSHDALRPVVIHRQFTDVTPGSVLIEVGRTRVLCTVSVDLDTPRWLRGTGRGWLTAEYAMLPGSSPDRISRSAIEGGRVKEIQRLIGRSLRAAVDLEALGEITVRVDCDVIQADGGTRTAAITGAWVALADAFDALRSDGRIDGDPMIEQIAAVSVGVVDGQILLDLAYEEDSTADVDCNVVMTGSGGIVEVQGTAEQAAFDRGQLNAMLDAATAGIDTLMTLQRGSRA